MSLSRPQITTAPYSVLIAHIGENDALQFLQQCCLTADVKVASNPEQIVAASLYPPHVVILSGDWSDPRVNALLTQVKSSFPSATLLFSCLGTPPPAAELLQASILGMVSPSTSPEEVQLWLETATEISSGRRKLDHARGEMWALYNLTADLHSVHELYDQLALILESAVNLLTEEIGEPLPPTVTGAILVVQDTGELSVQAALPPYKEFLFDQLPGDIHELAKECAEAGSLMTTDTRLCIPLQWNGRTRGVLFLEGPSVPADLSEAMHVLADFSAAALENGILFDLAVVDTTTRTLTRSSILQRLYEELKTSFRLGQHFTLLMMDLDRFKQINDSYGHLIGDRVLREVGLTLKSALRETDILGRYGGDEFLVILPNTTASGGVQVARRMSKSVDDYDFMVEGKRVNLKISIGVSGVQYQEVYPLGFVQMRPSYTFFQRAMELVIAQADGFMYHAKRESAEHIYAGQQMSWAHLLMQYNFKGDSPEKEGDEGVTEMEQCSITPE